MARHHDAFEAFATQARAELGNALLDLRLFGSVARGEATTTSDLDIFALVRDRSIEGRLHDIAFDVELKYELPISLIIRTPQEYAAMRGTRLSQAIEEGAPVV